MSRLRRREFIALVGGAAAWPLTARAEQQAMPVIGLLSGGFQSPPDLTAAFDEGLKSFGYVEGKNVAIEYRRAEGRYERLPAFAADLVARQVAVIVCNPPPASVTAARAATTTIPIVFLIGGDPVQQGLVASLDRPGGNTTGVTLRNPALIPNRYELLHELLPQAKVFAVLMNPKNREYQGSLVENFTRTRRGVQIVYVDAGTESEIEPAIASAAEKQADALVVPAEPLFYGKRDVIVASLTRHKMPSMFPFREPVLTGALMSYGSDNVDATRLLGTLVGRVLKGEKPADLPVEAPKVDLVINLKTAKEFGLEVPQSLLAKATELIE
jgi:putative ABC transport system substrate-binding protein